MLAFPLMRRRAAADGAARSPPGTIGSWIAGLTGIADGGLIRPINPARSRRDGPAGPAPANHRGAIKMSLSGVLLSALP
ncbi:hypothetical protein DWU99_16580 [Dyella psychrodurans]|uniref:Uncharacterized protein n=2 Tax=Dyella psychrodurans TaxID=1927960 RepID=A0A370X190_9GAMM|nr:hypothetical protein DWU99_16580 [Dyella psychrodurans]